MAHYTANWNQDENYRYAFDHTTHESVRRATISKLPCQEYERPNFPEDDDDDFKPEPRRKKRGKREGEDKKDDVTSSQRPRRSKRSPQPCQKPSDV